LVGWSHFTGFHKNCSKKGQAHLFEMSLPLLFIDLAESAALPGFRLLFNGETGCKFRRQYDCFSAASPRPSTSRSPDNEQFHGQTYFCAQHGLPTRRPSTLPGH